MGLIVYSNENNPATLKLIIAHHMAKSNAELEIKFQSIDDGAIPEPGRLPCLIAGQDLIFFSPNSAICYFLETSEDHKYKIYDWLEWEASILCPVLALLGEPNVQDTIKHSLINLLKYIENNLENCYLVGDQITAVDIAIWSSLYPIFRCKKSQGEYLSGVPKLLNWLNTLQNLESFTFALYAYIISEDICVAYKSLASGAKYLTHSLHDSQKKSPNVSQKEESSPSEQDSPHHSVELVSDEDILAAQKAWEKKSTELPKLKGKRREILPISGEKNILVTSALPYVNNVPHLGNIIGCVLSADAFARFSRLCNYNTLYICGTDEFGTATETKALEEGLSCKEICDKYFKIHNEIYQWFNISFDHFGRTSNKEQTELCQNMFLQLNDNGFMFTQSVDQLHCSNCDRYLADRFVEGGCPHPGCNFEDARGDQCDGCGKLVNAIDLKNPRCKICRHAPKLKTSTQFFIDLPKLEPLLHHWIKLSSPGWTNNAQVITKSWVKEGLKPRCITRDLKWGVPVPLKGFENKVFYVWFDAPIGYISITKAYTEHFQKWWQPSKDTEVTLYQFMAKDNVPFHGVLFPSMLLGCNKGYLTVSHIMATEYLNYEDGKFSKSRGVGVFGNDAQSTGIASDVWRFYLLYVRPESQDSSFSWSDLATKNNSELLNNLGNFVNRALVFAKNCFNKTIPELRLNKDDYTLLALCTREYKGYVASLEKVRLRDGIRHILSISRHGNQYMQSNQPWVLFKGSDEEKLRAGTVIGVCCNLACLLATLIQPYMPETSAILRKQLNSYDIVITPDHVEIVNFLKPGHKLGDPSPLFAKIDMEKISELQKKFAGTQNDRKITQSPVVGDIKGLEEQIAKQGEKVRNLKSTGAEKSIWKPEVDILLDLKKKLELANKSNETVQSNTSKFSEEKIKLVEKQVAEQASVVRKLKESGADKSIWQPEVKKLLDLKQTLSALSPNKTDPIPKQNKKLKK